MKNMMYNDVLLRIKKALQRKDFTIAQEESAVLWQQSERLTDPQCVELFYLYCAAMSELGLWAEIEINAKHFFVRFPDHIDGIYWMVNALYKLHRFDDMVAYKDRYLAAIDTAKEKKTAALSYPHFGMALYSMCKALVCTNHINKAIELGVGLYRMTGAKKVLAMMIELFHNHFQWQNLKNIKVSAQKEGYKDLCDRIDRYLYNRKYYLENITISACMIVKDEEMFLEQCLASICEHVDEIIVVDTGSSDRTVEIAKNYTDKVYYFKWINDFSAARKESIKYATGNWIFIIDADEKLELHKPMKDIIRETIESERDCVKTQFYDWKEDSVKAKGISNGRILQRSFVRFESAIHNQIGGYASQMISDDVILHHYGYSSKLVKRVERLSQTHELLVRELETCDSEIKRYYLYYQLGVADFGMQKFALALEWFQKSLEGKQLLPSYITLQAYTFCMRIGACMKDDETMRKYALLGLSKNKEYLDFYFYLGLYYERVHDYAQACYFFKQYFVYVYDMKFSGEEMLYSLTEKRTAILKYLHCIHFRGNITVDDMSVIRFDKDFLERENIILFGQLAVQISGDYATEYYDTMLKTVSEAYIFDNATSILYENKEYDKVHRLAEQAVSLFPEIILTINNDALAFWQEGNQEKAISILSVLTEKHPEYTQGLNNLRFMQETIEKKP